MCIMFNTCIIFLNKSGHVEFYILTKVKIENVSTWGRLSFRNVETVTDICCITDLIITGDK